MVSSDDGRSKDVQAGKRVAGGARRLHAGAGRGDHSGTNSTQGGASEGGQESDRASEGSQSSGESGEQGQDGQEDRVAVGGENEPGLHREVGSPSHTAVVSEEVDEAKARRRVGMTLTWRTAARDIELPLSDIADKAESALSRVRHVAWSDYDAEGLVEAADMLDGIYLRIPEVVEALRKRGPDGDW